jgi:NADH:ubiquinone oxidoreductase subunit 2 (subunit N)
VGSIGLGSQWRIKRFITFSAISHLGFIILAYISFSNFSYIYYIVIYAITSVLFFSNILAINTATCSEKFNSINKYISQNSSKNQYLSFSDMGGDI